VYWKADPGAAQADDEAGANKLIGKVVKAATDADATVRVRLSQ
jgi:predicted RecA/RadA family phage recombinase